MVFTVYILYSTSYDKIYIGFSSNLISRFHSHNQFSNKGWTKRFRPWTVIYCEYFQEKSQAMSREKQLKSAVMRNIIRNKISDDFTLFGYIKNL